MYVRHVYEEITSTATATIHLKALTWMYTHLYGTCLSLAARAWMTRPSVSRDLLMVPASLAVSSMAPDRPTHSLPARSTKVSLPVCHSHHMGHPHTCAFTPACNAGKCTFCSGASRRGGCISATVAFVSVACASFALARAEGGGMYLCHGSLCIGHLSHTRPHAVMARPTTSTRTCTATHERAP
jgi:hypothetical protein